ncbi:MAG TPA: YqgE/AlgH family protein [Acidimicrobiales bacterium]|nr:YqgE/AlgH family protein [Acidimicrobiales bacterium]
MGTKSMRGRLLVATPSLQEPTFDRTVILMLEHGAEGALGLVLNRPSEVELAGAAPEWEPLAAHPPVVFFGGPVAQGSAICLAQAGSDDQTEAWTPIFGRLGALNIAKSPTEVDQPIDEVRVFSGHAGWAPGQLEDEVFAGAWFVVDAEPEDALSSEPLDLWRRVLRRQKGKVALYAGFPADPALN